MTPRPPRNCIFCKIVKGEQPASILFRDELVLAFLDIGPINPGHALVIPVEHHTSLTTVSPAAQGRMMEIGARLGQALLRATKAHAFNLWLANGMVAGQVVMHTHLHVIPRFADDGFAWGWRAGTYPDEAAREELADTIRRRLETNTDG